MNTYGPFTESTGQLCLADEFSHLTPWVGFPAMQNLHNSSVLIPGNWGAIMHIPL
jgi:hypothetical protein